MLKVPCGQLTKEVVFEFSDFQTKELCVVCKVILFKCLKICTVYDHVSVQTSLPQPIHVESA